MGHATINQDNYSSLALLTDLYQLTMSYGYWKSGMDKKRTVFNLFFRGNPFKGGYTIACGLEDAIHYMNNFKIDDSDGDYLATLEGNDGKPLFDKGFIDYLKDMKFECEVDAIPEGTVVFPQEPLLRIEGPIIQCQILETALLNIINFQTLVATKASRITMAAQREPVLEFGLRRAQGMNGAIAASRAAHIGGCDATSNVLAGKILGIPVKGTHAHSWIMSFDDEQDAFQTYADAMPNNCVFLVDTYDTIEGVRKAVTVGKELKNSGHKMLGIRLDSGDLAYLSIEARKILDEGGFQDAKIVASNDLDEGIIKSLKEQGAQIAIWGVGTKLVTAYDQPALGGVYKLSAMKDDDNSDWKYRVKLSEQSIKVSNPGIQQVRRYSEDNQNIADVIYDITSDLDQGCSMVDPMDSTRLKKLSANSQYRDLLEPIYRKGQLIYKSPSLSDIRAKTMQELDQFHDGVKRLVNPHQYPVGIEKSLFDKKTALIERARQIPVS